MSEHTKEPWHYGEDNDGWYVGRGNEQIAHGLSEDNARRIVACVNSCAGIPTEVLEANMSGGLPWSFGDMLEINMQRDKLLDTVKNLRDVKGRHHSEQAYARLMEVLAEVEVSQ